MRNRRPMACTRCGDPIERGADYLTDVRQIERIGRLGLIKVAGASDVGAYHPACVTGEAPIGDRVEPTGVAARRLVGGIVLSAGLLYVTRDMTVPAWVLYAIAVVATWLTYRAYLTADRAVLRADEQQHRTDLLARPVPTATGLLLDGPRDEHIGHTDRDQVIARLGDRYADGYLTADEFETRSTEATQARTREQLAHVLRDLP